jgi:nitrous oxidase accessory protein NosD
MGTKMHKGAVILFVLAFLTASYETMPLAVKAASKTIIVPNDYPTISIAIAKANNGDTVFVKKGNYEEQTLEISKTLSLLGEDTNNTIIRLQPPRVPTGHLYLTPYGGVESEYTYANPIEVQASDVKISGFTITSNGGRILTTGNRTQITGNTIKVGLRVDVCSHLTIANNTLCGIENYGSYCYIASNVFAAGGIDVAGSNNVIHSNIVAKAGNGATSINLRANENIIFNNTIKNSYHGISVYSGRYVSTGSNNVVCSNRISNTVIGLIVTGGNNNTFYANDLTNNSYGAEVGYFETTPRTNCVLYHNNFIGNSKQVSTGHIYFPGAIKEPFSDTGSFDAEKEGNYWDDYVGTDGNGDGVGDTPYVIDAHRRDNYPLVAPFDAASVTLELPEWAMNSMTEPRETDPQVTEPFPTSSVITTSGVLVLIVGAGLLVYFKKRRKQSK